MRRAAWAVFVAIQCPLALAAGPVCCRLFGIDATSMLGPDPAICGKLADTGRRIEADEQAHEERRRAAQCALEAQANHRAFVYTYRLLVPPDIDLITQAVFGAGGERLLLKLGRYRGENIHTVESCEALSVSSDGTLRGQRCNARS